MRTILKQTIRAMAALFLAAVNIDAASFTNLYSFSATSGVPAYTNSDGSEPSAGLLLSGITMFGTTSLGGTANFGTVFRVNTDGTGFTNLYNFDGSFGKNPQGIPVLSGNTLYGTTVNGGSGGTVFRVNTDGTGFSNLFSFSYANGINPFGELVRSGGQLYGTANSGGSFGNGTVFCINTDGTGFTNIFNFSGTNGADPRGDLLLSGNTLYGTTSGGFAGNGTVFRVNTDGTGFTNLYSFTAPISGTNTDGKAPIAGLTVSGNTLYGTARNAGTGAAGTLFAVNTDGTGFTNLHSFSRTSGFPATNSDGSVPYAGVIVSDNTLYGAAAFGGSGGSGTIFKLNTDGTGFTTLYHFTAAIYKNTLGVSTNNDGAYPYASLLWSANTLYGTTQQGTSGGSGTVFALTLPSAPVPIPLDIQLIGNAVVLTWTDPAAAFSLHAAPAVTGVYTNVTGATSPFTNALTASEMFFQLQSN